MAVPQSWTWSSQVAVKKSYNIENKRSSYSGKDCRKIFYSSLREHAKNIINFEKNKMLLLTKQELKSKQDTKVCYICGRRFKKKLAKYKKHCKVIDHCHYTGKYRGGTHTIFNLRFNVPNEIPIVFYNRSNYDYHFIIK